MDCASIVLVIYLLSMHITAVLAHNLEFRIVEHLAELSELVFWLALLFSSVLLGAHTLVGFEVCAVFHEARDVDLRTDEVANVTARVEEGRQHEEVHKGRTVTATMETLDAALGRDEVEGLSY
jgi:hypothetical protein